MEGFPSCTHACFPSVYALIRFNSRNKQTSAIIDRGEEEIAYRQQLVGDVAGSSILKRWPAAGAHEHQLSEVSPEVAGSSFGWTPAKAARGKRAPSLPRRTSRGRCRAPPWLHLGVPARPQYHALRSSTVSPAMGARRRSTGHGTSVSMAAGQPARTLARSLVGWCSPLWSLGRGMGNSSG
jgi:hypothetical protein